MEDEEPKSANAQYLTDDSTLHEYSLETPRSFPTRILNRIGTYMTSKTHRGKHHYGYHAAPSDDDLNNEPKTLLTHHYKSHRLPGRWVRLRKALWITPVGVLALFGILHIILVVFGSKHLFWDFEESRTMPASWDRLSSSHQSASTALPDSTRGVQPIPCHSHNDYWRNVPLFDALRWGCTSVEADVWLLKGEEDELFVGHSTTSLSPNRTFSNLYVSPLVHLLESINIENEFGAVKDHGVFDIDPTQTIVLLIDFKTDGHELFPHVIQQLAPLREKGYLSYWDGTDFISRAVTVVGTGNAPFDLIIKDENYREIFFDAPLDRMYEDESTYDDELPHTKSARLHPRTPAQGTTGTDMISSPDDFNTTNSYYASVSLFATIGYPLTGHLTSSHLERIRGQIRGAKRRGLKARYWETPAWPTSLRNRIWELLVQEGVDVLNVDDLRSAAMLDWREPVGHYLIDA